MLLNSIRGLVEMPEPTKKRKEKKMNGKYPKLGAQMNNGDNPCV